jgi:branched-subunit amino acid ABC-type transport system permease component
VSLTFETVVIGGVTGMTYGLLGVGLVLVYRASKTINFAYAQIGAVGATVLAKLVVDAGWNWYVALALVTALGGLIGGLIEVTVIRPLAKASPLVLFVATIAVFQVMLAVQLLLPGFDHPARFPTGLHRTMTIGTVVLRGEHFMALALIPAIVAALAILLQRTPYGTAIVAAADNRDGAELAGISTRRVSTQVWVLTGALVTISAVLVSPLQGVTLGAQTFGSGPQLLLRALAAGLVGRLTSLPRTLLGGLVLGIGEAVIIANASSSANVDAFLLVAVLVLVLTLGRNDAAGGD